MSLRNFPPNLQASLKINFFLNMILFFVGEFEGFENPFVACCGHGGKYNFNRFMKCGAKKNPIDGKEIVISNTCKDPSVGYSTK